MSVNGSDDLRDRGLDNARHEMLKERSEGIVLSIEKTHASKRSSLQRFSLWWRSYCLDFRELVFYLFFLAVFCVVSFGPSGVTADRYQLRTSLQYSTHGWFYGIKSAPMWYDWMETSLLPNLYGEEFYVGPLSGPTSQMFLKDGVNRRIGAVRMRFIRVKRDENSVLSAFSDAIPEVYPQLQGESNVETAPYNVSTSLILEWQSGSALGNGEVLCVDTNIRYPPSGYVLDLDSSLENATKAIQKLRRNDAIDLGTRAVLVDYSIYNANTDEFAVVTLVTQFLATGKVNPLEVIYVSPLLATYRVLTGDSPTATWQMLTFLDMVLYSLVFAYIKMEWTVLKEVGRQKYFSDAFAFLDCANYALFVICFALKVNLFATLWSINDPLANDDGSAYINYTRAAVLYSWTEGASAFNCIITFCKLFKFLRPIRKLALFTETLRLASGDMAYMMVIIFIILLAFASAFNLGFGATVYSFISIGTALLTLFKAMLGDFDLDVLVAANPILGPFLFVLYIFLVFFVMLSMFLSVVDESYNAVREALEAQGDDMEPLERDFLRFGREANGMFASVTGCIVAFLCGGSKTQKSKKTAPEPGDGGTGTDKALTKDVDGGRVQDAGNTDLEPFSEEVQGGGRGSVKFRRQRDGLIEVNTPVTDELSGAFSQLGDLSRTTADMVATLKTLSTVIMKRHQKLQSVLGEEAKE